MSFSFDQGPRQARLVFPQTHKPNTNTLVANLSEVASEGAYKMPTSQVEALRLITSEAEVGGTIALDNDKLFGLDPREIARDLRAAGLDVTFEYDGDTQVYTFRPSSPKSKECDV